MRRTNQSTRYSGIEVKPADDKYRAPKITVNITLALFDKEAVAEYLRHNGYVVDGSTYILQEIKHVYHDSDDELEYNHPQIAAEDLSRITTLNVCGQVEQARSLALEIVGDIVRRKL